MAPVEAFHVSLMFAASTVAAVTPPGAAGGAERLAEPRVLRMIRPFASRKSTVARCASDAENLGIWNEIVEALVVAAIHAPDPCR